MMKHVLDIRGPDVASLVVYFQQIYGWEFEDFRQESDFKGYAIGTHPSAHDFEGIGISDGTYVHGVEEYDG